MTRTLRSVAASFVTPLLALGLCFGLALFAQPAHADALSGNTNGQSQAVQIRDADGSGAGATVFVGGALRVEQIGTQLFSDTFDTGLDTTNRWAAASTGGTGIAATSVVGQTVLDGGTTANSFSELHSQTTFAPTEPGLVFVTFRNNVEFPVLTTGYRFWGLGTAPGSPTIASPMTEGAGWEVATDGKLYAVMYATGTRNVIQDLSAATGNGKQPKDASAHKYFLWFSGSLAYWAIDSLDNVVATMYTGAPGPNVNGLPLKMVAISNGGTHVTITDNGTNVADTGRNTIQLSDGTFPWRKASISSAGALSVAGSFSLTNPTVGAAVPATANYVAGNKAGNLVGLTLDGSSNLNTNCVVGCSGGTFNNNADAVATSATNGQSAAWLYGWNGASWDRLQVDASKFLKVNVSAALPAGANVIGHVIIDSGSTTVVTGTVATNVSQINAVTPLMGNGVTGTGSQRVTIASDNTAFSVNGTLQTQTDTIMVGGTNIKEINAVAPLMGNGVTGTGSLRVTLASDTTSNSNAFLVNGNVTPADAAALGTTSIRTYSAAGVYNGATVDLGREVLNGLNSTGAGIPDAGLVGQCDDVSINATTENSFSLVRAECATHALVATLTPSATAGGTTQHTLTLANTTNATNVKASAGQVYAISGFNMSSATPVWISTYNNSGTPTCGTSIIQQFLIPGSTTGAGFVHEFTVPKVFSSGIAYCATTGIAGTGAPAASTYVVNIDYK